VYTEYETNRTRIVEEIMDTRVALHADEPEESKGYTRIIDQLDKIELLLLPGRTSCPLCGQAVSNVTSVTTRLREQIESATEEAKCRDHTFQWRHAHFDLAAALDRVLTLTLRVEQGLERACTDEYVDMVNKIHQTEGDTQELSENCVEDLTYP